MFPVFCVFNSLRDALATHLTEIASLTNEGHVMLSNLINGSSDTKAATELAVKNAIAHLKSWSPNANAIVVNEDTNTTQNSLMYSKHANNPTSDVFYYVETLFYESKSTTIGNWQFAKQDTTDEYVFVRSRYGNAWNPWRRMLTENLKNVPGGVAGLGPDGKLPVSQMPRESAAEIELLRIMNPY